MPGYCQVLISATTRKEANAISDLLVKKKLIAGSLLLKGPSRYWWEGRIVEKEYYNVQAFTLARHKKKIIDEVKGVHSDQCPIIAFFALDGNKDFLRWIEESVRKQ